jgi:hypothetical protein
LAILLNEMNGVRGTKAVAPYVAERSTAAAVDSFMVGDEKGMKKRSKEEENQKK